jgi:hypothetical protein
LLPDIQAHLTVDTGVVPPPSPLRSQAESNAKNEKTNIPNFLVLFMRPPSLFSFLSFAVAGQAAPRSQLNEENLRKNTLRIFPTRIVQYCLLSSFVAAQQVKSW